MTTLRDLRLDGNRLTGLPSALGSLTALTRLSADNNALVSLPASLSRLSSLRELSLENNRLAAPVVDVDSRSEWVESFDARTSELADGVFPFAWLLNGGDSVR